MLIYISLKLDTNMFSEYIAAALALADMKLSITQSRINLRYWPGRRVGNWQYL
jgi:hypothetical protein